MDDGAQKDSVKGKSEDKTEKDESLEFVVIGQWDHFMNIEVKFGSQARVQEIVQ